MNEALRCPAQLHGSASYRIPRPLEHPHRLSLIICVLVRRERGPDKAHPILGPEFANHESVRRGVAKVALRRVTVRLEANPEHEVGCAVVRP